MIRNGMVISPSTAAIAPSKPWKRLPTYTAKFIWFEPGSTRLRVSALRNSSSSSHFFSSTITRRAQAERPPPKLARLILLKVSASSSRRGFVAGSVMHKGGVMRKLLLLLFGRFVNRIGRFVFPRRLPVPLEHGRQVLHDGGIANLYGNFPSPVECWSVKVLRTEKRPLVVDDEKLGMRAQILLFVDLRAGLVHQAPQGE